MPEQPKKTIRVTASDPAESLRLARGTARRFVWMSDSSSRPPAIATWKAWVISVWVVFVVAAWFGAMLT